MARLTAAQRIDNLLATAHAAISYVGFANYDHRERAATAAVNESARTGQYVDPDTMNKS